MCVFSAHKLIIPAAVCPRWVLHLLNRAFLSQDRGTPPCLRSVVVLSSSNLFLDVHNAFKAML